MANAGGGREGTPMRSRRRLAPALSPLLIAALCACGSSRPPASVQRTSIPPRPTVQQPKAAAASPARPQALVTPVTPGTAGGPAVAAGAATGEAPLSREARAVTSVPLPPLTAAGRAAAAPAALTAASPIASPQVPPQVTAAQVADPKLTGPQVLNPQVPAPQVTNPPVATAAAFTGPAAVASTPGPATTVDEVVGQPQIYTAKYEDTLLDLAIDKGFGFLEIRGANPGVDPWLPGAGTQVLLPYARILPKTVQDGLVLNLPEQRLFLFKKGRLVDSFPIGVFRDGFSTPVGSTTIVRKTVNPTWYPPASAHRDDPTLPAAVPPGPDNPLGTRAMYLGWPMYLIHGTHKPYGVGRRVSRGCIRMYPADVERLYDMIPVGTAVHVVNQPIKIGWLGGELFVQAHPTLEQGVALEETGQIEPIEIPYLRGRIEAKAGPAAPRVDWPAVERALTERRGHPVQVTNVSQPMAPSAAPSVPPPTMPDVPPPPAATALVR